MAVPGADSSVIERQPGCGNSHLRASPDAAVVDIPAKLFRMEIADLAAAVRSKGRGVERGDGPNAILTGDEGPPKSGLSGTDRRYQPKTGDHDSVIVPHVKILPPVQQFSGA
jgi:hypothetical protein